MFIDRRESGRPGEFDGVSDAEIDAKIKMAEAVQKAKAAQT